MFANHVWLKYFQKMIFSRTIVSQSKSFFSANQICGLSGRQIFKDFLVFQQSKNWFHARNGSLKILSPNIKSRFSVQIRSINIAGDSVNAKKPWKNIDKSRSPFGYLFVILPIATFCLGTWQIYRLQWKLNLIAKLESIINKDPIDLPEQLDAIQDMEYTKIKVKGYFDLSSPPQFIFPRSLITRDEGNNQGSLLSSSSKGSSQGLGAQLVVPFVITDERFQNSSQSPLRILVNLGWVPRETMETVNSLYNKQSKNVTGNSGQPEEINLIGVIRKTEKREPFTPKQEFTQGYWTRRDIEKMSQILNTWPIFLDAFESYPVKLGKQLELKPIGGQTRVNLRNEHLSYIITWYSLTGIFSYLWYKKIFLSRL